MFDGFFKSEFHVDEMIGRSVTYVHAGKLLGGNSGFAHIGSYQVNGDDIAIEVTSHRHNGDHPSLLGSDVSSISVTGRAVGTAYHFRGTSPQMPGAVFRSVMTPLEEDAIQPPGAVGLDGIANGLYSIHFRMLDGVAGGLTGVMLLNNGRILGGDAFFYYLGSYSSAHGRWRGEILNQEHTPARGAHPIFGGHDVGIGFSGTCSDEGAELEATAFAGKRSVRLQAVLKLMCKA